MSRIDNEPIDNLIQITSWLDPDDEIVLATETISNREWMEREVLKFSFNPLSYKIISSSEQGLLPQENKIAIFREKKYKKRGKND